MSFEGMLAILAIAVVPLVLFCSCRSEFVRVMKKVIRELHHSPDVTQRKKK